MEKLKNIFEKLNIKRLNHIIKTSDKILKILYVLLIVVAIYVVSLIFKELEILQIVGTVLKILSPFFIGFFIAWLLNPLVTKLTERKVSRALAITIVFTSVIAIIVLFIVTILPLLGEQIKDIVAAIPSMLTDMKSWASNIFDTTSELTLQNLDFAKERFFAYIETIGNNLQQDLPTITVNFVSKFVSGIGVFLLSFVVGFYLLFNFNNVSEHFTNILPRKWRKDTDYILVRISDTLHKFVRGTLLITFFLFIITFVGFSIIGLNAPLLIAIFCAITNLIPYIGPYMGAAVAGLIGFTQGPVVGVLTLAFILVTQTLEGNFLHPLVMSKKMNLHPVTILLALLIFGYFFGILGMIFATPIVALLKIVYVFFDEKFRFFEYEEKDDKKKLVK